MPEIKEELKLPVVDKQDRDLRLYFLVYRPIQLSVPNEGMAAILSYDLDKAIERAKQIVPLNYFMVCLGYKTVKELLEVIQIEGSLIIKSGEKQELPSIEKISIEQFRNGLMLVANEYCEPKDREILLDILKRVSLQKVG